MSNSCLFFLFADFALQVDLNDSRNISDLDLRDAILDCFFVPPLKDAGRPLIVVMERRRLIGTLRGIVSAADTCAIGA
jgi:hypothetical protein